MSLDNVKAVVLAAGKGVRMKSERPKVLHEILGRPVLDFVLRNLRLAGVQDVIVVVGHQADRVKATSVARLFRTETNPILVLKWNQVYQALENVTDACEDVANVIEGIVLEHA